MGTETKQYAFLDTWALADFTKSHWEEQLAVFVDENDLELVVTSLSLVELYNRGWRDGREDERCARVARFLGSRPCTVVSPRALFRSEYEAYPQAIARLPTELDLKNLPPGTAQDALLLFMRRDPAFLSQGKDIRAWAEDYATTKDRWLSDVDGIIDHAVEKGTLRRNSNGEFVDLPACMPDFLTSLDLRHLACFSKAERKGLGEKIVELFHGKTSELPAVRLTSLLFWYAYVAVDPSNKIKTSGSDIGDMYQMSLIPYCGVFTVDRAMGRLCSILMANGSSWQCQVMNKKQLEEAIS